MSLRATALCFAFALSPVVQANNAHHGHHGSGAQPYAGQQQRQIKALSDDEVAALLKGDGMGYAKPAELNGYPGPSHVLELADALSLDADQRAATQRLMQEHKQRARELGAALVEAERHLDRAFAHRHIDEQRVTQLTMAAARLQAQLRAEHLATHLAQTRLLSSEQVRKYNEMRGYAATSEAPK